MKKLIIIAATIYLFFYLMSATALAIICKLGATEPFLILFYIVWIATSLMFVCCAIILLNSDPKPRIKRNRIYKLRTVMALNNGKYTIVLSHDDNVETYKCVEIAACLDPIIGNEYRIEIENGAIYFIPI